MSDGPVAAKTSNTSYFLVEAFGGALELRNSTAIARMLAFQDFLSPVCLPKLAEHSRQSLEIVGLLSCPKSRSCKTKQATAKKRNPRVLHFAVWREAHAGRLPIKELVAKKCKASTTQRASDTLIGGWGVLNREVVSFRSCVRRRGLVA